jgi:hypothetical protein
MNKKLEFNELKSMFEQGSMDENSLKHYVKNDRISQEQYNDIIGKNTLEDKYKDNPLIRCLLEHTETITPNAIKFKEGKNYTNLKVIREFFEGEIKLYPCDNLNKYYEHSDGTLEEIQTGEERYFFKKYIDELKNTEYKYLSEIFNLAFCSTINIEDRKILTSNIDIIKFKDGIYNLSTLQQVKNITKDYIPRSTLEFNFNYTPIQKEKENTTKILKYIFKEPKDFLRMIKNIFFNYRENKGFGFIYGASGSGKSETIINKILSRLTKNHKVNIDNINKRLERVSLETNGLTNSIDEIQNEHPESSFLNEYSGNKEVTVNVKQKRENKTIKTAYLIFIGEDIPNLKHDTSGTYKRALLIETQKDITKMPAELLEFIKTDKFIDTLFYFVKELHKEEPELYKQNLTASTYNMHKKDLISVLKEYIYSEPNSNDRLTNQVQIYEFHGENKEQLNQLFKSGNVGYRLTIDGLKQLIEVLYKEGKLNNNAYLAYSSQMLTKNILPYVVSGYDSSNMVQIWKDGRNLRFKMDLAPTSEAIELLRYYGIDIEKYQLINKN